MNDTASSDAASPAASSEERTRIVQAFAARARLELSDAELERLSEYVTAAWDMADRLRHVETPGREGLAERLPLRSAWANVGSAGEVATNRLTVDRSATAAAPAAAHDAVTGDILAAAAAIRAGELTPSALITAQLARITDHDEAVRSYITVDETGAQDTAEQLTAELARGEPRSLLHGIPFGAKDSIPAAGMPCTYNSPLLCDWVPARDAEAIRRLRAAGAVLVGKHNLNEFGWSIPGEDDFAPPPRNPWFPEEYSVGSSSGGGAAVAAGLAMFALGTDGGGSTRLPGGQHLLYGLKPTHERVTRLGITDGLVSEVGLLTRTAADAAAVLAALLIDPDASDAARLRSEPPARVAQVESNPAPLRIGLPQGYLEAVGMEDDVKRLLDAAVAALAAAGHEIVPLPAPALDILHDAVRANFVVIAAEHYFDHEGPGRDRSRYGPSAGFYNLPGACLTAADYLHALRVGKLTRAAVDGVLTEVDLLLTPTSPVTRSSTARNPKTHRRGGNAAYTAPFNLTGHPALSVPMGLSGEGMPIGLQLVGPADSEFELLQAGRQLSAAFELPAFPEPARR